MFNQYSLGALVFINKAILKVNVIFLLQQHTWKVQELTVSALRMLKEIKSASLHTVMQVDQSLTCFEHLENHGS